MGADIITSDGDPREDTCALRKFSFVMKTELLLTWFRARCIIELF